MRKRGPDSPVLPEPAFDFSSVPLEPWLIQAMQTLKRLWIAALALGCMTAPVGLTDEAGVGVPPAPARLPSEDLLLWRSAAGTLSPVLTVTHWENRRAEIVRGMEAVMGPLPGPEKRVALEVQVVEEVDCGGYLRRLITYQSEPGNRVPAYLCVPKEAFGSVSAFPAVLCLHPTDHEIGHGVVVGLGGRPNRAYAGELAGRGYVVIAPSYPHLAGYSPDLRALGYVSGTMKAIWDNVRALDVLDTLPFVKQGRYGAIGHSLGGHNAVYTAVFDPRLAAVVSSCGLDSYLDYYGGDPVFWQPGKGWCQDRYMPRLAGYTGRLAEIPFDFAELIGALAPRPTFLSAPLHDSNFQWESVARLAAAAAKVYELHGAAERLEVAHPDCGHDFPDAMRERAYGLFDRVLR